MFHCETTLPPPALDYVEGTDGFSYKFHKNERTWQDAEEICLIDGGSLAIVWDEVTNSIVRDIVNKGNQFQFPNKAWIGLTDQWSEGVWQTAAAAAYTPWYPIIPLPYENWDNGEPNNAGNEDCATLYRNGYWNDDDCDTLFPFVCQRGKLYNLKDIKLVCRFLDAITDL